MIDTIPITDTETFMPRFDGIVRDSDRPMEHVVMLADQGRVQRKPGSSLNDLYIAAATDRLITGYWDRDLFAPVADYYSFSCDAALAAIDSFEVTLRPGIALR